MADINIMQSSREDILKMSKWLEKPFKSNHVVLATSSNNSRNTNQVNVKQIKLIVLHKLQLHRFNLTAALKSIMYIRLNFVSSCRYHDCMPVIVVVLRFLLSGFAWLIGAVSMPLRFQWIVTSWFGCCHPSCGYFLNPSFTIKCIVLCSSRNDFPERV